MCDHKREKDDACVYCIKEYNSEVKKAFVHLEDTVTQKFDELIRELKRFIPAIHSHSRRDTQEKEPALWV